MTLTILREREVAPATPLLRIIREPAPVAVPPGQLWNLHSHSQFSNKDALSPVKQMVSTVAGYGQPALGLTDHGNMAGSAQLYVHARKTGILPFPGSELYVVPTREDTKAKRHHMCVVAYTTKGYENLCNLSSLTHRNFFNKPLIDHADLATLSEQGLLDGIAATSGCFFSLTSQAVVRGDLDAARSLIATYAGWFPKFYVELQNHNIEHDKEGTWTDARLADELLRLANELGVPTVLTQDAHYCTPDEKPTHEILKRIVAFGPEADDAVFPGDGFHLANDDWFVNHHTQARLSAGSAGLADLLEAHDLKIKELDSYSYNIPFTVADPDTELSVRCQQALVAKDLPKTTHKRYLERLNDELEIVRDTGMGGYLVLVAEVTDWCRDHRVFYQARGSAAGSMICWLLDITGPDPIKYDLRFERFISRDRTKPPDIDLDIEYDRRQDLIAWLRTRFAVQHIGTWIKYSLEGEEDTEEGGAPKGSLRVGYFSRLRAMGVDPIPSWAEIAEEDKRDLYTLDAADALSSYGVHPAGLVVTTTAADQERLVPLMRVASSDTMVSQYDMKDVEELGVVKLDVLGLKTLSVLNRAMTNLGRDVHDGLDWIPLSDTKTFAAISRGDTDGVFQLEGGSARRGCRELGPTKLSDVIAAMGLFRPAVMESGATQSYIDRKHHRAAIPTLHPVLEKNTKHTYGILLFQEQVVAVLRDLGMGADDLTDFLKAIKASQKADMEKAAETIAAAQQNVMELCDAVGMGDADFDLLWEGIEGFSKYGFNSAHATVYGITAYRCAYLSVHHPQAFFAALLAVAAQAGTKRGKGKHQEPLEKIYVRVARKRGLRLRRPHINRSSLTYTVEGDAILKGLVSIDGVGDKQAAAIIAKRPEGGWTSLEQMCRDVYVKDGPVTGIKPYLESIAPPKKKRGQPEPDPNEPRKPDVTVGTIGKLWKAGALEVFEEVPGW